MPIAELITGYVTDRFDIKIPMLIGVWIQIIQIVLIIYAHFPISNTLLILIALTGGLSEGMRNISVHAIEFGVQEQSNITHYYANKNFFTRVIELVLPLAAAYLVTVTGGNFDYLFQLIIGLLIIKTFFVLLFEIPRAKNSFDLKNILTFPGTNKDKMTLAKGVFLEGLSEGITLTILPVIVLIFAESILKWGYVNASIAVFGTLVSLFLTKWVNDINSKVLYALGAFIFAGASTFFISEINFLVIIMFLLANELMQVIKDVSYNASVERIMEEDRREYRLYSEYQFFVDTISCIGRVIPIGILFLAGLDINNDLTLRITLIAVGILPIISLSVLGKSRIFQPGDGNETRKFTSIRREKTVPTLTEDSAGGVESPTLISTN
jgi:MFS family permease